MAPEQNEDRQEQETVLPSNLAFMDEVEEEVEVEADDSEQVEEPEEVSRVAELEERLRQEQAKASRLAQKAERLSTVEQRLEQLGPLLERLKAPDQEAEPKEQVPDPDDDPVGHAAYQARKTREELAALRQQYTQQQQAIQQRQQEDQWLAAADASAEEFARKHPDYLDAAEHYAQYQEKAFKAMGYDDNRIAQNLEILRRALLVEAQQTGSDPASLLYEKARFLGYVPKKAEATEVEEPQRKPAVSTEQKAQKIKQSASLGAVGGAGSATGGQSAKEWFSKMSDTEFAAFFDAAVKKTGMDADKLDRLIDEGNITVRELGLLNPK